jgi:hypothetical protein
MKLLFTGQEVLELLETSTNTNTVHRKNGFLSFNNDCLSTDRLIAGGLPEGLLQLEIDRDDLINRRQV